MKTKNLIRRTNIMALCIFIFSFCVQLFFSLVKISNPSIKYIISITCTIVMFLTPTYIIVKSQDKKAKRFLPNKSFKLRWLPVIIVTSLTATLGGILLNALVIAMGFENAKAAGSNIDIQTNYILLFIAVALVPAVLEEIFFRGAMLTCYTKRSKFGAVLVSALMFAFLHGTAANFIGPFLAGAVYALLVIIFDSVYPAIIAHLINNALTTTALFYYNRFTQIGINQFFIAVVIILFFILLYLSLRLLEPYVEKIKPTEKPVSLSERIKYNENSAPMDIYFFVIAGLWVIRVILDAFKIV